jgi:DNA modification methylase
MPAKPPTNSRTPRVIRKEQIGNCTLYLADCRDVISLLDPIDSIVTDPPYGLSFMQRAWDYDVPDSNLWGQCFAVIKPGGHLVSFFGSRTYHRGVVQIENAGFDIRDQIMWIYGSGFPKSHNLDGKHEGLGTALKPAHEPVCLARKPFLGTVDDNVCQYGTGALNITASRVPITGDLANYTPSKSGLGKHGIYGKSSREQGANSPIRYDSQGRWPANIIHDGSDEVLDAFPDAPGQQAALTGNEPTLNGFSGAVKFGGMKKRIAFPTPRVDLTKSSARFFYCAKASKSDRDEGLDRLPLRQYSHDGRNKPIENAYQRNNSLARNSHPTVKPTRLMEWLIRLITPQDGIILDPFMGSGSTGKAAALNGFAFIGIEKETEYFDIACKRIEAAYRQSPSATSSNRAAKTPARPKQRKRIDGQQEMFVPNET